MKVLTIIDTFGFFFRQYYALPYLKSGNGFPTGLLTGFINFISSINKEHGSDYLLFALDSKEKTKRCEIDPNYKANRPAPPEDLLKQLPVAIEWIKKMGFKSLEAPGYEADDIIATIAKDAKQRGIKVQVVSSDKDLYQLIDDDRVLIYDPVKKIKINEEECIKKFGVKPTQIVDYLAIVGDSSDNIPGVKGIGDKGAKKLLEEFGSLKNIYENLDKVRNQRTRKLLEESKQSAFLSYRLASLYYDVFSDIDYEEYRFPKENPILKIKDELEKYDMKRILQRASKAYQDEEDKNDKKRETRFEAIVLDTKESLFEVLDKLSKEEIVAFDTETTSLNSLKAKIVGFSFATDEKRAYYVPIAHNYLGVDRQISKEDAKSALEKIFTCKVVGQNLKYDLAIVENNFSFENLNIEADTMVMAWLLDPQSSVGLDALAKRFFNYDMVKFKDTVKKGENFSGVDIKEASFYAAEDAWMTLKLYRKLLNMLEPKLLELFYEVEREFIRTLLVMEKEGIKIDTEFFRRLLKKSEQKIEDLTKEIYFLCDKEFNINSTQQLGRVLFEDLGLPVVKKTKTGYSTDEKVLNKLLNKHAVIPKILEYREIYKLKSTYIEPLLKLALKEHNHRIHTSFLHTGTATGRLSSKNPNLQNIPVKTELGREVREGFVAKEGYTLLGVDYSQIELRLLAHFSKDSTLCEAFSEDKDIHMQTAVKIFGPEMAKEKRGVAKSINFGLLYGMGARKLADTLNITTKEAKSYIKSYFENFPTVKEYLKSVGEEAKKRGFVETILGRKRFFDFENANGMQLAMFEREAVNTLFQGSAADIIKLSMNKIVRELVCEDLKLLLQIHDELIFEVQKSKAEEFARKIEEIMENIISLRVPLKVSVGIGENWGKLK